MLALPAFSQGEPLPEELLVVTGRQPGPPMWRVSTGENVLWILPLPDLAPGNLIWDSSRVAHVISEADEVLMAPDVDIEMSRLIMFNPINIIRGMRLGNRIRQHPDESTLEEVLPQELYARFSALKAQYFPRNSGIEEQRPLMAATTMVNIIHREWGIESAENISKQVRRLIRRSDNAEQTTIETNLELSGNFRALADRIEAMMASLPPELELACFEAQIERMETDPDGVRRRADAWAHGSIDEFRLVTLPGSEDDVCIETLLASSEGETIRDLIARQNDEWLEAAERALATNGTTVALLNISTLLMKDGPIAELAARGYEVREP